MRTAASVLVVLAVTACAPRAIMYNKPGGTEAEFNQDKAQCEYDAHKATAGMMTYGPTGTAGYGLYQRDKLIEMCLRSRGYTPTQG